MNQRDKEIEDVARWIEAQAYREPKWWVAVARALLDSGALTMPISFKPKCNREKVNSKEVVVVITDEYTRQAAAIEKIKGGGDA